MLRRHFISAATGSFAFVGLSTTAWSKHLTTLTEQQISKVDIDCTVFHNGRASRLKITSITKNNIDDVKSEQFILNFESAASLKLPEASYKISYPELGVIDLFLQPCGQIQNNKQHYRACIARLI